MSGQRLYAMLCVRARPDVRLALGKKLRKGGKLNDDAAYTIITYPTVSEAVATVAALFASDPKAQEARFCLGVVEAHQDELGGRAANVIRSLADQAHPGQVLLTSAARDIARGNLPARLALTRIGDVGSHSPIAANGSTLQRREAPEQLVPMRSRLFWNGGAERGFYEVSPVAGAYFGQEYVGRGAAVADYDNDGNLDFYLSNDNSANRYFVFGESLPGLLQGQLQKMFVGKYT